MRVIAHLHSSKEDMEWLGTKAGMTKHQLETFVYALYEVEFELDVDEDGNAKIVSVDKKPL